MQKTRRYKIYGKVQNVFFRDFTKMQAQNLNIVGWVRNCSDGTVESVATASANAHSIFAEKLAQGPKQAKVSNVKIEEVPLQEFTEFIISPSV